MGKRVLKVERGRAGHDNFFELGGSFAAGGDVD